MACCFGSFAFSALRLQCKDIGGEAKVTGKENGDLNAAAGKWKRRMVTSPELLTKGCLCLVPGMACVP